jgi:hypothetical protein
MDNSEANHYSMVTAGGLILAGLGIHRAYHLAQARAGAQGCGIQEERRGGGIYSGCGLEEDA